MPKKVKEEAEWVDGEVAPDAGEKAFMSNEKLAGIVTANAVHVNLAPKVLDAQTPLENLVLTEGSPSVMGNTWTQTLRESSGSID